METEPLNRLEARVKVLESSVNILLGLAAAGVVALIVFFGSWIVTL